MSTLPPLGDIPGCGSERAFVEARGCKEILLPETGLPAQMVWLTGWRPGTRADDPPDAESFTAVRCAVPEMIGRVGSFAAGPEGVVPATRRVVCTTVAPRDVPFITALIGNDLEALMTREPCGALALDQVRDVQDGHLCLVYDTGNLVARVRGEEHGSDVLGQLVAILDAAVIRAAELSPPIDEVNTHVEHDEALGVPPGAASLDDARSLLKERSPRRILGRGGPDPVVVRRAFAQSYAQSWNAQAEELGHAAIELPRYGVRGRPLVSIVGSLPDGRPVRVAHVTDLPSLPRTSQRRAPIQLHSYDVAVTRLDDGERANLDFRLGIPLPGEPGAWLAGELLVVARPARPGVVTSVALDVVRDEAARYVELGRLQSTKSA